MSTADLPQERSKFVEYAEELRAFLASQEQKVLLIHGLWGTGKTYFWRRFVKENHANIREGFYSYVSLFGSSSLANVKSLVMLGGKALRPAETIEDVGIRIKNWLARKRRYFEAINLPRANLGRAIAAFEELLIKDYLVCFDDLERRNKALDLEQVFGFVSVLKEQNDCRVVIICNEEELSRRDRRILTKYREKIVDRQLTYHPPFAENFGLIFNPTDESIREVFQKVVLNNIRVFQQTLWCLRYFEPHLKGCHDVFIQQFRQQCAKLACIHFAFSKDVTVEQAKSTSWVFAGRSGLSDKGAELIRNLEFMRTDADDLIITYLLNGYCDMAELKLVVERLNRDYKRSEADAELSRVWEHIWDTYKTDTDAIAKFAKDFITKYHAYLPFDYTNQLLEFVKKIAPSFDADSLRDLAARSLVTEADASTIRSILAACRAPTIQEAARARQGVLRPTKSIYELVAALGESDGWDPADFALLNEYSDNELFDWLGSAHHARLLRTISEVMARGQLSSADNTCGKELGKKFRRVLDRLSTRSELDKLRTETVFKRVSRRLKEFGLPESPEICPAEVTDAR